VNPLDLRADLEYNKVSGLGRYNGMSDERIEQILRYSRRSMEMEGFKIDAEQETAVRKILNGELDRKKYIESIKQKAMRYAHEI
jgi:hypothetical protein